jgi:RNA polymerase sigma-70 factor, ECF subfamily
VSEIKHNIFVHSLARVRLNNETAMDLDPNELKTLARKDEQAAVVQLIELYYERVFAFLRRLCGNEADAADLTQRTFGRVQQALLSFAGRSTPGSWIHGIAYHLYLDWRRANHRTEPRADDWWEACASLELQPDEAAARTDLAGTLYSAVDRLGPDLRDSVHLHYYQELTLQETADAMEVATSTDKYRLRQAMVELPKALNTAPQPSKNPGHV